MMLLKLKKIVALLTKSPRYIFLIDGLGGALTALLLGIVLPNLEHIFGMPAKVLFSLSAVAFVYSIYSLSCFYFNFKNLKKFLNFIIFANLFYCCLSMALVFLHYDSLTSLGLIYFFIELLVIIFLVALEVSILRLGYKV